MCETLHDGVWCPTGVWVWCCTSKRSEVIHNPQMAPSGARNCRCRNCSTPPCRTRRWPWLLSSERSATLNTAQRLVLFVYMLCCSESLHLKKNIIDLLTYILMRPLSMSTMSAGTMIQCNPQHKHFHFIVPSRMTMMIHCLDRHAHVRLSSLVYEVITWQSRFIDINPDIYSHYYELSLSSQCVLTFWLFYATLLQLQKFFIERQGSSRLQDDQIRPQQRQSPSLSTRRRCRRGQKWRWFASVKKFDADERFARTHPCVLCWKERLPTTHCSLVSC